MGYHSPMKTQPAPTIPHLLPKVALALLLLAASGAAPARAAVVVEGSCTATAPERSTVGFRAVLTRTGARIVPSRGETLVVNYAKAAVLVLDAATRSYFVLPLDLAPALLAEGLGYDPRTLGASATGKKKAILGHEAGEVVVTGIQPRLTLRTWRLADPAWSAEYALLERALRLPWTAPAPPAIFTGLPLAGTFDLEGRRPARASCEVAKLTRDDTADEGYAAPANWQMDYQRLIELQIRAR